LITQKITPTWRQRHRFWFMFMLAWAEIIVAAILIWEVLR